MPITGYLSVFAGGFLLALVLTPVVRRLAIRWGAIDQPGERKIHTQPVPRLGGLAVLASVSLVVAGALLFLPELHPAISGGLGVARWGVLAAAVAIIGVMGVIDDLGGLPARMKLLVEILAAAAVVLVAGAPSAIDFSPLAFSLDLGYLGPVVGILLIVAVTNAVNMIDGVDGVAGGVAAIGALAIGVMSIVAGHIVAVLVMSTLAGALIGFLPHNFRIPKIFLGDVGSLTAGFLLGAAALVGLQRGEAWFIIPALLALAVPLAELSLTVLRRTLRALSIERATLPRERFVLHAGWPGLFIPDRRHIPHRLLDLGLSKPRAIALLYLAGAIFGALGLATLQRPELGPFVGLILIAVVVYFAPRWLYHELRVLERGALLPILESRLVRRRSFQAIYDGLVVFVSSLAAEAIVMGPSMILDGGYSPWHRAGVATAAALVGFWVAGLYRAAYRHAGISEALRATRSVVLGMLLVAGALLMVGSPSPLAAWLVNLLLVLTGVMGARLSFRLLDHLYLQGRAAARRALIFGAGRGGDLALREIRSNPRVELEPVGFVDDDLSKASRRFHGLPVYAAQELEHLASAFGIDDLVLSTRKLSRERYRALAEHCSSLGLRVLHFDLHWTEMGREGFELSVKRNGLEAAASGKLGTRDLTQAVVRVDGS